MKQKRKQGFTVIELLVASAIFTTFLAIAVGSFSRVLQVQRTLTRRIIITSALNATIESMAREIRVGYDFPTEKNNESMSGFQFKSLETHDLNNPVDVSFGIGGGEVTRNGITITPSDVTIGGGTFVINQKKICDPWRITIALSAYPTGMAGKPEEVVNVQTTVTSRVLPIEVKEDPYKCKEM